MDSTATSNLIISKYHWFDRFLAGLCILLSLFMIVGMGATTSVSVRKIDASMGLLTKEVSYFAKNINKISRLMGSVEVSAQFAVAVVADFARLVEQAAMAAFKQILQAIVKSMLSTLSQALNGLLSGIKGWIKTLSGLLDTVKSFLSAVAMKVYALGECNVNRSVDVVSDVLGVKLPKIDSATTRACGGEEDLEGQEFTAAPDDLLISNGTTFGDLQATTNAFASLRISNMLSHVAKQSFVNNSGSGKGASDAGNSTKKTKVTLTQGEIDTKKSDLAYTIGILACDTSKSSSQITSALDPRSYTVFNAECTQKTAEASEQISRVTAADIAAYDKAESNAILAAPQSCGFQGYISETPATKKIPTSNDLSKSEINFSFDGLEPSNTNSKSFAANSVLFSQGFNTSVVNNDQCQAAIQVNTVSDNSQAQISANNKPTNVDSPVEAVVQALLDSTIKDLTNGIELAVRNFVNDVFTLAIEVVNKFTASLPGGEFLSSSLTGALNRANLDAQNNITRGLNALKGSN